MRLQLREKDHDVARKGHAFDLLSVDDVVFVEVLEGEDDVGGVKGGEFEFEALQVENVKV